MKNSRTGSALLIVLGMLAFMVVSAVSFSMYMRSSRAPSSYLRRNVADRFLVKAALARAIEEVDYAVGNDPFPGAGYHAPYFNGQFNGLDQYDRVPSSSGGSRNGSHEKDFWAGRVLAPGGTIPWKDTTSVLTLEALGYLPAPLVNDVRYWSRRTTNAVWKTFNYDLGRYAFCAVNVSDFFDINRMSFDCGRSSAPDSRISLSYLLAKSEKTGDDNSYDVAPDAFEQFLENPGGSGNVKTFASLMDFNLALGWKDGLGVNIYSPFYSFIKANAGGRFFQNVGWSARELTASNAVMRQVFVTDSVVTNIDNAVWESEDKAPRDLANPIWQPFDGNNNVTLVKLLQNAKANNFIDEFYGDSNMIQLPTLLTLCDYLDEDNVPLSLAMPCIEQTPQIVAISGASAGFSVTVRSSSQTESIDDEYEKKTTSYYLELGGQFAVSVGTAFPFRRTKNLLDGSSFKIQGAARFFLVKPAANPTTRHRTAQQGSAVAPVSYQDWNSYGGRSALQEIQGADWCGLTAYAAGTSVNVPDEVKQPEDAALPQQSLTFDFTRKNTELAAHPIATITKIHKKDPPDDPWVEDASRFPRTYLFHGVNADGTEYVPSATDASVLVPYVAVWVRVVDKDGKTVDLVPATLCDDALNENSADRALKMLDRAGLPILPFISDLNLPLNPADGGLPDLVDQAKTLTFNGGNMGYLTSDPRYNYAPENWYQTQPALATADNWAREGGEAMKIAGDKADDDIFITVSNAGYLQSIYELMFLPRVNEFRESTDAASLWGVTRKLDGRLNTSQGCADAARMWRTYRPNNNGWDGDDDFTQFGFASYTGRKINPYTDIARIFMGAIVQTPFNWWAAATTNICGGTLSRTADTKRKSVKDSTEPHEDGADARYKYVFGPKSQDQGSQWTYSDCRMVAGRLMQAFQNKARSSDANARGIKADDWKTVYDNIDWLGENDTSDVFQQISKFDDLYLEDRKFLYGYWRDCFDVQQQLFLVFVRAEPTALGGTDQGLLGGRAVALVWRDPRPPKDHGGPGDDNTSLYLREDRWRRVTRQAPPHETRVLFYHQFD